VASPHASGPDGAHAVRLPAAQRGALAGHAVAGLITAALMSAPFVLPPRPERPLASRPLPRIDAVVSLASAPFVISGPAQPASVALTPRRRPIESRAIAVETVAFRHDAAPVDAGAAHVASVKKAFARKPFGRRLATLFTGDGTHAVRPFPTVASER
jgi:hypothetical protein